MTRLRPATTLDEFEREGISGFGDREARQERRATRRGRRQQRRDDRRERKSDRRIERVQRQKAKVREKLATRQGTMRAASALQPVSTMQPSGHPPGRFLERGAEWLDDVVQDGEEDGPWDEAEEATEGMGAWSPFRRSAAGPEAWGPSVSLGRRLRIQAAVGHRAAVIELKPGLYLVADLPDAAARTEFGLLPLLAPMMIRAARRSMDEPAEGRGPLGRLFRRRSREGPIRYVQVAQPSAQVPSPALPGPVDDGTVLVPAPNVGWADDATVAATYGCDSCDRRCR